MPTCPAFSSDGVPGPLPGPESAPSVALYVYLFSFSFCYKENRVYQIKTRFKKTETEQDREKEKKRKKVEKKRKNCLGCIFFQFKKTFYKYILNKKRNSLHKIRNQFKVFNQEEKNQAKLSWFAN